MGGPVLAGGSGPCRAGQLAFCLGLFLSVQFAMGASAGAGELQLGATSQYTFNSNFFSNAANANSANSFQFGPTIQVSDTYGRFEYDVTYDGLYQAYVDQDDVDAWESRLRARVRYEIDRRTVLQLTDRFRDISNLRFSRQDIELADTALDPNQDRYFRNDVELELIRQLTGRLDLSLRVAHHWIDFKQNIDRNDSQAVELGAEFDYQVATQHSIGVGGEYTYQDFEGAFARLGSKGQYVSGSLSWTWDITDALQFRMNGGPSWIRSDEDNTRVVSQSRFVGGSVNGRLRRAQFGGCGVGLAPAVVGVTALASNCDFQTGTFSGNPESSLGGLQNFTLRPGQRVGVAKALTFFGGAAIQGRFSEWVVQASYSRRQSTTSGDGLASSLDRIALDFEFDHPNFRWSPFVAGSWDRRETLTEATFIDFELVPVGALTDEAERDINGAVTSIAESRSRRDNYTAIVGLRGAVNRNWSGTLDFRFRRTESRDRGISRPGVDTYFVVISVDYLYDLIQF